MPAQALSGPRLVQIADQILADIRRRGLRRGEAYLSTAETAQWLRIGGSTVNRALQLLAQRGVIERRQRRGTMVLDPSARGNATPLRRVHVLVREDHLRTEGLWGEGVLLGLQGSLPGAELQFNLRPQSAEAEYVQQLIADLLRSRQPAGLVLVRSTITAQRIVVASGLPAVVSGTPHPSIRELPSVDRDQHRIGVLLAEHLLDQRCRRFVILMRERLAAGDHAMLDGAMQTFAAAGVGLGDVTVRCLPTDEEVIRTEATSLLSGPKAKVGFLCRSEPLARGASAAVRRNSASRRSTIVVADVARRHPDKTTFASIQPACAAQEWGASLGRMLAECVRGQRPDPFHLVIPVRLCTP
ncbi:MAG TPA: GntR family transcriptional regulator [Pirellulales bacterium]|jgi:DNA-binding LacI/PurR family transcriptional regulator/DNA-binding transcriptional regulator YhcF (GntR family)|nr:GntR family transcriptional regulator [Pirellulales bacterium]